MTKKEQFFLKKIYEDQVELADAVKDFQINSSSDLDKVHPTVRRGMIHAVADIFELTLPLSDEIKDKLPLNKTIIKEFRNIVAHTYGTMTNLIAYACIKHCIEKEFMKAVKELSDMK